MHCWRATAIGRLIFTMSQKKTSPLFLAVTPESILGYNIWHTC